VLFLGGRATNVNMNFECGILAGVSRSEPLPDGVEGAAGGPRKCLTSCRGETAWSDMNRRSLGVVQGAEEPDCECRREHRGRIR
jgi:hypothetical protein